ncbi:hypothetical protein CFO_g4002 [Ceratocystis platani]|uniref:CCHC-type domain-containing protein n=1 Tax=Ceratocystis fimbriata f. sp. platani TaxID=88771 RepID=A0A0F8BMG5_CERFI|nr:hypothetical protein CFO_g4002 [Ceratocystis platani]
MAPARDSPPVYEQNSNISTPTSSILEQNFNEPKQTLLDDPLANTMVAINIMDLMEMIYKLAMEKEAAGTPKTETKSVFNPKELTIEQLQERDWSFSVRPELMLSSKLTWPMWYASMTFSLKEIGLMPDEIDSLPEPTKIRIIRTVQNTISLRLLMHVVTCESFTSMIEQLQTLTIGNMDLLAAEVEQELWDLKFEPGETLLEFLERYQLLLIRLSMAGIDLRDSSKKNRMMTVVGKHYPSLRPQAQTISKFSTLVTLLRSEAEYSEHKRPPIPRASPRTSRSTANRQHTRCWNCDAVGHYSNKCPEKRIGAKVKSRANEHRAQKRSGPSKNN